MYFKRIFAAITAAICAAAIFTNGENKRANGSYAPVKIQQIYTMNAIKANIENDPASPFSVYAKNEFEGGANDASRLYAEIAPVKGGNLLAVPAADTKRGADFVCGKGAQRAAHSADGSVWLYASNYFVGCDRSGVSLVLRSPVGMIKSAPKDASDCIRRGDRLIETLSDDGRRIALVVSATGAERSNAYCVVDTTLSSPLLYDFAYFANY